MKQAELEKVIPILNGVFPECITQEIIQYLPRNDIKFSIEITQDPVIGMGLENIYWIKYIVNEERWEGNDPFNTFLYFSSSSKFKNFTRYTFKTNFLNKKYNGKCIVKVYNRNRAIFEYYYKAI